MFYIYQSPSLGWEYLPASAITPKVGLALHMNSGALVVATGTTKPTYICMCEKETPVNSGELISVVRVTDNTIFETTSSVAMTSVKSGNKVTLSTDGLEVTATTTDGVAEIISIEDTAKGGKVRVRFA